MRLQKIKIEKFAGIDHAEIEFDKPVTMITGLNNQGKSSIKDAILFALTGKCRAMRFSKDAGNLIRGDGMAVHLDYMDGNGGTAFIKRTKTTGPAPSENPVLRYCLNPSEFITAEPKERAKVLSDVLGGGMNDVIKQAIVDHIGNINEMLLSELKGSGVNLLDLEAFRKQIVEQRRSYKRIIEELPDGPPVLAHFALREGYDPKPDKEAVKALGERIAKGGGMIAAAKLSEQAKANVLDLQNEIRRLKESIQDVPKIPDKVSKDALNMAPVYLSIIETMLSRTEGQCPVCTSPLDPEVLHGHHDTLLEWYEKYRSIVEKRERITKGNEFAEAHIAVKETQLKTAKASVSKEAMPVKDGEQLLVKLQAERDEVQARLANYARYQEAQEYFKTESKKRGTLEALVKECDRISDALKDGGPVKAAVAAGGRELPISESLLKVLGMEALTWSDSGEISLRDIPIEYCSASEQYRAACVMALALADVSGVGICALDGFEILDAKNANAFMEAISECRISNVLVMASSDKDYSQIVAPDWLSIWEIACGFVKRVA